MENNLITVVAQQYYRNRTLTQINPEKMDRIVLGYVGDMLEVTEKIDRTIVKVPNSDNLVIVYNKYQEEAELHRDEEDYELEPTAIIPELDLTLYSRCIACRIDENNNFASLHEEDIDIILKYLCK